MKSQEVVRFQLQYQEEEKQEDKKVDDGLYIFRATLMFHRPQPVC